MSPERAELPQRPPSAARRTPRPARRRPQDGHRSRDIVIIVVMLLFVVRACTFSASPVSGGVPLHLLYRRLYYIPIIYAAFVFGKRGGALSCPRGLDPVRDTRADRSLRFPWGSGFDNWIEIASFFAAGLLFGAIRDTEEHRTADLRQVSLQLEDAYKKLEERAIQLINIQDYTQSILRSITSGVLTVGPDGSVATANPAAERMLGMSEFEMVPKPIGSLFQSDGGISRDVAKVLAGRLPLAMREATLVTASGSEVHVQASTSRMRAVGGTVLGAVVTLEDVSDIKALTDQLIRADRLAAMGELTAGVAHEVRNPLGVIRASVQLLEDAQVRPRAHPRGGRGHQAGDRPARPGHQGAARLRPAEQADAGAGRTSTSVLEDVVLFTNRFAKQHGVHIEERFERRAARTSSATPTSSSRCS